MHDGQLLYVDYITSTAAIDDISKIDDTAVANLQSIVSGRTLDYWMNAGSTKVTKIVAGNSKNIVLYPSFAEVHTAMFVDQQGNVLATGTFDKNSYANITELANSVKDKVPAIKDCKFDHWEIHITNDKGETTKKADFSGYKFNDNEDIVIFPIYSYNGTASLIPVDTDGDGEINYYEVDGFGTGGEVEVVEIPAEVNNIPVTTINADSFSSYPDLYAVRIPVSIEYIGTSAIAEGDIWKGEEVTLYYDGSYEDWTTAEPHFDSNWERGMGTNSRIFFLNGGDQVDLSQGYLQFSKNFMSQSGSWSRKTSISNDLITTYSADSRPDQKYWVSQD